MAMINFYGVFGLALVAGRARGDFSVVVIREPRGAAAALVGGL